jgi:hypothetical protein
MSDLLKNARLARPSTSALDRVLIVTGDYLDAKLWDEILHHNTADGPKYWVEKGKKGNLLGALQAYSAVRDNHRGDNNSPISQIVMLFGSGTRLSPFTQSLRNVKAAFPLPDGSRGASGLTIGEAAIRSAAPLINCLRQAGFHGVVLSWGDEVLIPSKPLIANPDTISSADVIRFGWRKDPDSELATQKEWLQVDMATNLVVRDISRQPLDRLTEVLQRTSRPQMATFVNLGSFAATHEFLSAARDTFGKRVFDESSSANWDPYFWQALQSPSRESWDELIRYEQSASLTGLQSLLGSVPDFFEIVQHFRMAFEQRVGRPMRISVFDFGEPYWIDAGNHVALSRAFTDLFSDSQSGAVIRAFLGLPDSISAGENFIADSSLPVDHQVENSIVIGTTITGKGSSIRGAIVLGSNIGRIIANHGASVIWCHVDDLRVDGPNGIAFRLDSPQHVVLGDESATTLRLGERTLNLKYSRRIGNIDHYIFEKSLPGNPVSFSEAASLVKAVDPIELHRSWLARLARVQLAGIALLRESRIAYQSPVKLSAVAGH